MLKLLNILALAALLLGATPALAQMATIKGDVTYRERIALPPGGTLSVALVDLERPEAPRVTAAAEIASPGQVPLTFTLNFETAVVESGHSYGLVAEIVAEDGTVWFRNPAPYAVDPLSPATPIVIIVSPAPSDAASIAPPVEVPAPPSFLDATWQAESIAGIATIRGAMSSLSVASDRRAGGRGGCNSWFAQAEVNGEVLVFSAVAATRMACLADEVAAQEERFFAAIAATRFWKMRGEQLVLVDAAGGELAIFSKSRF